jgi:hypothetical protein
VETRARRASRQKNSSGWELFILFAIEADVVHAAMEVEASTEAFGFDSEFLEFHAATNAFYAQQHRQLRNVGSFICMTI